MRLTNYWPVFSLAVLACGTDLGDEAQTTDALAATSARLVRRTVSTDPLAVCNDGSPAIYYVRRGHVHNLDRWVIHLKGGSSCSTWEDCNLRFINEPKKVSSTGWGPSVNEGGIFDPDPAVNPTFHGWNHVYVPYCSSDLWAGDGETTCDAAADPTCPRSPRLPLHHGVTVPWRGRRIVRSIIRELRRDPAVASRPEVVMPDLDEARFVVFAGSSAGAAGMRHNLDWVAGHLPNATVRGVVDSAFSFSGTRISGTTCEPISMTPGRNFAFWGEPPLDRTCRVATEAAGLSRGLCLNASFLVGCNPAGHGFIETPFFVHMDQVDQNARSNTPYTRDEFRVLQQEYLRWAAQQTAADWGGTGMGLFSTDLGAHTAIKDSDKFFGATAAWRIGGLNYSEVLLNWLSDSTPTQCAKNITPACR